MPEGFNTSPFVLPNMFDRPGDALQQGLYNQERRADRQAQIDYRNQREKEADDWRKYQVVKETFDPSQIATGEITSEEYFDNEAKRVMNEILADPSLKNSSFVDFYGAIQKKWLPIVSAADRVKNGLNLIDASVKAEGTGNDNLRVDDLARDAKIGLVNDMIPIGANGRRNYDISNFRPDRDYVGDIVNSENGWRYLKSGNALIDYVKNFKTTEINPHKQLGNQSIIPYKGRQTPFVKLNVQPNEIGRMKNYDKPDYEVMTEDDFLAEGDQKIPIKVLDKNIYEQHILGNKKNREALDFMWNSYKERNGLVSKNATEDEKRKRAFAIGIFDLNDPSEITSLTPQHLPRNTTNNTINMGSGAGLNDLYGRIKKAMEDPQNAINLKGKRIGTTMNGLDADAQKVIFDYFGGRTDNLNETNTFIADKNGVPTLYRVNSNGQPEVKKEYEVGSLSRTGTNIKVAANVDAKKVVVAQGEPNTKATEKTATFIFPNGKTKF